MSEEAEVDPPGRTPLVERLLPPVEQLGADGQPKPWRMTPQEQLVAAGLGFANIAIAGAAASAMQRQQAAALLAGLVASALTLVGARVGNRLLAMLGLFASVVTRSTSTTLFLAFGLPYYGAALWMFFKYNRLVKAQAVHRRQQRAEARGAASRTPGAGRSRGKGTKDAPTVKRPTASKRYTPPKPTRKRPPPPAKPPKDRSPVD